ncbi:alanyl-tRNA editing protein [Streptomyces sp. YGL11-2]|uniref:alanyl-tRNA editing protein n=1 Tax=Streptomyces sp. YGL11-2 TaxID=3414028 RepID=UPI003CE7D839
MTKQVHRTQGLWLENQDLREWQAVVLAATVDGIVLDRSAFYPGGGGQPPDHGVLLWQGVQTAIVGTRKQDELYLIPAEDDPLPPIGTVVTGALDNPRRTALMRTHSALHLLSGVVYRDFGALVTGCDMGPGVGRMDFTLSELAPGFKEHIEELCAVEIEQDRRIDVRTLPAAEAFQNPDLIRTATNLLPPDITDVRVVDIVGLDVQADGGTHVGSTKQIGRLRVKKCESKGTGKRRIRIELSDREEGRA